MQHESDAAEDDIGRVNSLSSYAIMVSGFNSRRRFKRDGVYKMYLQLNILAHCQHEAEEVSAINTAFADNSSLKDLNIWIDPHRKHHPILCLST